MPDPNNDASTADHCHDPAAAIIFSTSLVKRLAQDRLPPTYIGVRRVRPRTAQKRLVNVTSEPPMVFKIVENGKERRMTSKEKKEYKRTCKQQTANNGQHNDMNARKEISRVELDEVEDKGDHLLLSPENDESDFYDMDDEEVLETSLTHGSTLAADVGTSSSKSYVQLEVNPTTWQDELSDVATTNHRHGLVPPVALSASMARIALLQGILPCVGNGNARNNDRQHHVRSQINTDYESFLCFDPDLSNEWAQQLKDSMKAAEQVRQEENLRPMPYQIVPEPWTRLRPPSLLLHAPTGDATAKHDDSKKPADNLAVDATTLQTQPRTAQATETDTSWSCASIRSSLVPYDQHQMNVIELLYRNTPFYFSCGAKFGCDFLLYDGPREDRHAFAGLRIVSLPSAVQTTFSTDDIKHNPDNRKGSMWRWPLPSAYDMAGYVRCLNTAGKLALLATTVVVKSKQEGDDDVSNEAPATFTRVAIVDLALEKVLSAPTHQRRARKNARREAGQHLAKR